MKTIVIEYNLITGTLCATPSPLYTETGRPGHAAVPIAWVAGENVSHIEGVAITGRNGGAFTGPPPQHWMQGHTMSWHWGDPNTTTSTYEYVVSAHVPNVGVVTLDPQIINVTKD